MPARSRALASLTTAAVALALLAGCTGGTDTADPTPLPTAAPTTTVVTPTPTATPTPTPTPTAVDLTVPPTRPAAMETPSADGAAAAASYFLSLYPYMYATGDTSEWDAMSADTCEFCTRRLQGAQAAHANGGHRQGGSLAVESASGVEIGPAQWYSATVVAAEDPSTDVDASGSTTSVNDGGRYSIHFALTWADGWTIDAVDVANAA